MMVDDKFKSGEDDEYEFSESTGEHAGDDFADTKFVPPPSVDELPIDGNPNHTMRNVIIGLVVVVLAFAGYKLAGTYSAPKHSPDNMMMGKTDTNKQVSFEAFLKPAAKGTTVEMTTPAQPVSVSQEAVTPKEPAIVAKPEEKMIPKAEEKPTEIMTSAMKQPEITKPLATTAPASIPAPEPTKTEPVVTQTVTTVGISKQLERKLSDIADQAAENRETLHRFESNISGLQQSLNRMDQRISALDEQVRQAKTQQHKVAYDHLIKTKTKGRDVKGAT